MYQIFINDKPIVLTTRVEQETNFKNYLLETVPIWKVIKEIQKNLYDAFNKNLYIDSKQYFARFFKRGKYDNENEIRLCIDFNEIRRLELFEKNYPGYINHDLFKSFTKNKGHILVPIDNEFFSIEICELICGQEMTDIQFEKLSRLTKKNNIKIF